MPDNAVGSAETHKRQRRKLRRRLEAQGVAEWEIERRVAAMRHRQRAERNAKGNEWREELEAQTYARFALDDSRHRPTGRDSLATGAARLVGVGARAARRSTAITRWEWEQAERKARR